MSLFKIDQRLKQLGLKAKERREIIDMVREFVIAREGRMPLLRYLR